MTVVAAFDFDGTLGRGDSLLPFLRHVAGRRALSRALVRMPAGRGGRSAMKERLVGTLLGGRDAAEVAVAGAEFARRLETRLVPGVAAQARRHAEAGHRLVLVSASLGVYLEPLGSRLGFAEVVATELEEVDGVLTGRFRTPNCRGPEKLARLASVLETAELLYAYGNSDGDADLLARADIACHVRRHPLPAVITVPSGGDVVTDPTA